MSVIRSTSSAARPAAPSGVAPSGAGASARSRRRASGLVLTAWAIAAAALVGLGFAVAHYLANPAAMPGTAMGSADALTRAGGAAPSRPLFSTAFFTAWQLDAVAVAVLVLLAAAYLTAAALVPVRNPGQRWSRGYTASFLAGLLVAAFATNGSIAVYDQALFTAHMAGHLALVMAAPALLTFGRPLRLLVAATPAARRPRLEAWLRGRTVSLVFAPPVALAAYTVAIVGSHLTGLMDVIMRDTWAGQVEHLVYVVVGCWFFTLVVGDEPLRWRLSAPARWLLLAVAMAVDTFVGVVLLQQTSAIELVPSALHVNALSDTRTGGAIMWFGGDGIMALIMVVLVVGWLRNVESKPTEQGWLEQARSTAFGEHTGQSADREVALDEDEEAREAYNAWLARLDRH